MSHDYLSELNEQQRAAVVCTDAPQLVIAGAGSGKTRVLTYKIVHLLAGGYEPWRILALTFTNKAAREMRERIEALAGHDTARRLWMGTFHSIFARLLRTHADRIGFRSNFTIYDAADSKSLVKTIIRDLQLDDKVYKASSVLNSISAAKNALISPEAYAADRDLREADARSRRPETATIYRIYAERCRIAGAMDFDDLLYFMNVLLRDNDDILRHYREFFRYVLVDEYQDTNFAQHLIVSRLTSGQTNVCVVGDDAQSIYSFRGANIANILNLQRTYPDLKTFKLERNYRSTRNIVDAAGSLISKNRGQIPKNVFSEGDVGAPIELVSSYSDYEESYLVANRISQIHMRTGDSFEDFAILYRTNAQSRILEESLRKRNIPYRIYGGVSFYQRKEVKDAIAYMRLAINPSDEEAIKRVINFPSRGIGDTTVSKIVHCAVDNGVAMWDVILDPERFALPVNSGTLKKLAAFRDLILSFNSLNASGADAFIMATDIVDKTKLLSMLVTDRTPESISKQENLRELLSGVHEFVELRREDATDGDTPDLSLGAFMTEVSLATDQDVNEGEDGQERVTLMTAHAAKGLEFGNVFIVGVEEDLFPSSMGLGTEAEIEEERRLLYVAITRAKRFCMLSYAGSRFRNGQTTMTRPSRFIADIDSRFLKPMGGAAIAPQANIAPQWRSRYRQNTSTPSSSTHAAAPANLKPLSRLRNAAAPAATHAAGMPTHGAAELAVGMRVNHAKFGNGTIVDIDAERSDARITVDFDNTGQRTLLLKFARFNLL